jgi:hypothetical protein
MVAIIFVLLCLGTLLLFLLPDERAVTMDE